MKIINTEDKIHLNTDDKDLISLARSRLNDGETVNAIKGFFELQQIYNAAIKEVKTKLEILDEEFKVKYDHNPIHHIESRLKNPLSIYNKLEKKNCVLTLESIRDNVTDIAGIRVICNYTDDIYTIADLLLKQSDITLIKKKDYVKSPKPNGYRSLHLVVMIPIFLSERVENVPVEIQIRTIAMDFWASLEHQLKYKTDDEVSNKIAMRLKLCAESINHLDDEMLQIHEEIKRNNCD